jgi:hypothetical protein
MSDGMTTLSVKVPDGLAEDIEEEREENEPRSGAIRRLLRKGLEPERQTITLPILLMWFGSFGIAAQYLTADGALGPAGLLAFLIGLALTRPSVRERYRAARARFTDSEDTAV